MSSVKEKSCSRWLNWSHIVSMGRDQHVQTVERGFLFPFGFRANVVTVTERKFKRAATLPPPNDPRISSGGRC